MGVCFKGFEAIAQLLLDAGADPNKTNFNGSSALMFAVLFGKTNLVNLLMQYGANPNLQDGNGNTALYHAKMQGNAEILKLLQG